jgi:heavy metal sensor kinase
MLFFRRTMRARLTLLYVGLLSLVLILYGGFVSMSLWHTLIRELDASLDRDGETVENVIAITPDGHVHVDLGDRAGNFLLEVWSKEGELQYRSKELGSQMLGPPVTPNNPSHPPNYSIRLNPKTVVRVITKPHRIGDRHLVLRLGVSEAFLREEYGEMLRALVFGLPVALLIVGITGYSVARRTLRPLDAMARRAKQINAEHLNERLIIENPDDELGNFASAFNETLTRLQQSFGQLERFTADASHELRTPLTAMRAVGEVALQSDRNLHDHAEVIGSMLEEVYRLTGLIDTLLLLSRADSGHLPLNSAPVALLDLAAESAGLLEILAEEKKQSVQIEGDGALTFTGDRFILRQAFVALIHNAVKYSPPESTISVRIKTRDGDPVVEVHDHGPGIPLEHRPKIFDRFYRVDKARSREEGGAGLGLSIAEWAVRAHGGKIELECEPEPGCTFRVCLPKNGSR